MNRFLNKWLSSSRNSKTAAPSIRPQVEALEERSMMSITDMTGVASLFPRHSGPTMLYLNFDGWTGQGVSSFQSTTGNRTQDIHDIIFKTSQIFAPFDVEVRRIYGNGAYDSSSAGNTTIFIGDKTSNGTGTSNGTYAYTPWVYCDFPGQVQGISHRPNSDAFDIGYVDGVYNGGQWSNLTIARAIAHEAGHTFGLAHVLSSPSQEIMSYDAANVRFYNTTFNITNLNNNGTSTSADPAHEPEWHIDYNFWFGTIQLPVTITTQNSYTFLQTVLGARSTSGDFANVADSTAVDSTYADGSLTNVSVGSTSYAGIQRSGDFDVYQFYSSTTRQVSIDVSAYAGSGIDTVLFVYSNDGKTVQAFNDDRGDGTLNSRIIFNAVAGQSYKIVVGSYGANSTGSYQLSISNYYSLPIYNYYLQPALILPPGPVETGPIIQPISPYISTAILPSMTLASAGRGSGGVSDALARNLARVSQAAGSPSLLAVDLALQNLSLLR
jgi:hypothetical protein